MVAPRSPDDATPAIELPDAALARESRQRLAPFVGLGRLELRLPEAGPPLVLPAAAVSRLVDVLAELAAEPDDADVGLTGAALVEHVWPHEDFSDWERAGG